MKKDTKNSKSKEKQEERLMYYWSISFMITMVFIILLMGSEGVIWRITFVAIAMVGIFVMSLTDSEKKRDVERVLFVATIIVLILKFLEL